MSDSGSVKKIADSEWLRTLYVETWKRYEHDDTLAQTRGTIFTAILAAITAFIGVFSIQVVKIPCPVPPRQYEIAPGIVILGLIWFGTSLAMVVFNNVNQACKFYFNARGANLRAIEAAAGLGAMAPATFEHKWRKNSEEA